MRQYASEYNTKLGQNSNKYQGTDLSKAQPGDIIVYTTSSDGNVSYFVAIYAGENKIIELTESKGTAKWEDYDKNGKTIIGIYRFTKTMNIDVPVTNNKTLAKAYSYVGKIFYTEDGEDINLNGKGIDNGHFVFKVLEKLNLMPNPTTYTKPEDYKKLVEDTNNSAVQIISGGYVYKVIDKGADISNAGVGDVIVYYIEDENQNKQYYTGFYDGNSTITEMSQEDGTVVIKPFKTNNSIKIDGIYNFTTVKK